MKTGNQDKVTASGRGVARGTVLQIQSVGRILVETADSPPRRILCDFLHCTENDGLKLEEGDEVLVLPPSDPEQMGCVMGRVGPYAPPDRDRVEIEAGSELVLKCGCGSVTMRKDGKVLTRGTDIVSRASRRNRIKGGSVEIN